MSLSALQIAQATGATQAIATQWLHPLETAMAEFGINTPKRQAAFLAQCGHESGGLRTVEENLNYSAEALLRVFPKYFTAEQAASYARKPERIANRVYANRMGNGPEASGDGWKYRGKGPIQLTGKVNHQLCGQDLKLDLIQNPNLLLVTEVGARSACWFWEKNNLNRFADTGDFKGLTRAINGGYIGLEHRMELWAAAKVALGA